MVGQADAVGCGVSTAGLAIAEGSVVGVGVADAVNVGGGAVAVWVVVALWLGTAVGIAIVGVADGSILAA